MRPGQHLQDQLYSYLAGGVDPYDFMWLLPEFAEEYGLDLGDDPEVESLDPKTREKFRKWIDSDVIKNRLMHDCPTDTPAYMHFDDPKKLPAGSWLIHFCHGFRGGFDRGATLERLALSTWFKEPVKARSDNLSNSIYDAVFAFALDAESFGSSVREMARQYGSDAVLFQSDVAVSAYHWGDEQEQVIFPVGSEYNLVGFTGVEDGFMVDDDQGNIVAEFPPNRKGLAELCGYLDEVFAGREGRR